MATKSNGASSSKTKRYYWLKLKRDFFKRHDIRIIESMPNGKDYILFYLKLLCESVDHDGNLRFNEQIPYNEDMLATITNTNVDIVRSAINVFTQLQMMDILDDGTFYMNEVNKMLGSETEWAEKKRNYRESQKALVQKDSYEDGEKTEEDNARTKKDNVRQEIEKEKEKELELEKEKETKTDKEKRFVPPSVEEVAQYVNEKQYHVDPIAFVNFYQSKGWKVGKNQMVSWRSAVSTWEQKYKKDESVKRGNNRYNWDELNEWARQRDEDRHLSITKGELIIDE